MSTVAYEKRLSGVGPEIHAAETDEPRRMSLGHAWLVLIGVSLGIWAAIGVIAYRLIG